MTFWCAFYSRKLPKNALFAEKCSFYSRKLPKNAGVESNQAKYIEADTVYIIYGSTISKSIEKFFSLVISQVFSNTYTLYFKDEKY